MEYARKQDSAIDIASDVSLAGSNVNTVCGRRKTICVYSRYDRNRIGRVIVRHEDEMQLQRDKRSYFLRRSRKRRFFPIVSSILQKVFYTARMKIPEKLLPQIMSFIEVINVPLTRNAFLAKFFESSRFESEACALNRVYLDRIRSKRVP